MAKRIMPQLKMHFFLNSDHKIGLQEALEERIVQMGNDLREGGKEAR